MILWKFFKFLIIYNFIKANVLSEDIENDFNDLPDNEVTEPEKEAETSKNFVLDSVYDTLRHNYETKLQQNIQKLNMLSDIRNKRNTNDQMTSVNYQDYYKNHQLDINRKNALTFPLGFKNSPKVIPIANPGPPLHRSDYYDEDYGLATYQVHKCHEKPSVHTFQIADQDGEHKHHPSLSSVLLTGLKYLFGGFAILALPFLVLKAIFLPIKFFLFFKGLALLKTFLAMSLFMRFLRYNRRRYNFPNRPNRPAFNLNPLNPTRFKSKLQTIKDILNSQEFEIEEGEDDDYRNEEEVPMNKENESTPMYLNNPFNSSEVSAEFLANLEKLIKLKSKKW